LRGVAALTVVFYHWQGFFHWSATSSGFQEDRQPFFYLFKPLFLYGYLAVNLFFCLSGFIFYWLYAEKIASRKTTFWNFSVLRFSRLYPLHFLTLIFTAIAQQVMLRIGGSYFVLIHNDLYHFVLQLFFASNWGFEKGNSFDGSIWSVSIEVLLYALFFIVCLLKFRQWWSPLVFILAGFLLIHKGSVHTSLIGRGMEYFFLGGLTFYFFSYLHRRFPPPFLLMFVALTTLLWTYAPFFQVNQLRLAMGHHVVELPNFSYGMLLFPMTIITLAWYESSRENCGHRLALLGNLSYSSYLIHFPLQIVFAGTAFLCSIPNTVFYSPGIFLFFFAVLICLSYGSHRFIEMPAQNYWRGRLMVPASVKAKGQGSGQ